MGVYAGPKGRERASREAIDSQRGVIPSKGTSKPDPFCAQAYFLRAEREITVGISMLGAASPRALNCSGFRNITEQLEQA
jgi:hypothetical protein